MRVTVSDSGHVSVNVQRVLKNKDLAISLNSNVSMTNTSIGSTITDTFTLHQDSPIVTIKR